MGKRIIEFYYNHFPSWFKELMRSLYNVGYYARWVWQDRNWHCDNLYELIGMKLRKAYKYRTKEYNFDYWPSLNGDRMTRLMLEGALICDRLQEPRLEKLPLFNFHSKTYSILLCDKRRTWKGTDFKYDRQQREYYKDRLNYILKHLDKMWD